MEEIDIIIKNIINKFIDLLNKKNHSMNKYFNKFQNK
jgi:hypothetical protein